jgi:hypothetical protein
LKTNAHSLDALAPSFGFVTGAVRRAGPLKNLSDVLGGLRAGEGLLFSFATPLGGHACAAYHSRGTLGLGLTHTHLYLFDPNYGEYKEPSNALADLLVRKYGANSTLNETLVVRR